MQKELEKLLDHNKKSAEMFSSTCFPTKKTESWIYTNPELLFNNINEVASDNDKHTSEQSEFEYKVVFINGKYQPEVSTLPDGVTIHEKNDEIHSKDALAFFNENIDEATYLFQSALKNSYRIYIRENTIIESPIALEKISSCSGPLQLVPNLIYVECASNTNVKLIEIIKSEQEYNNLISDLTKVYCDTNSNIEFVRIISAEFKERYLGTLHSFVKKNAIINSLIVTLGANISRHQLYADIVEENATANYHGLFSLSEKQHCDNYSIINHLSPKTFSSQLYKGVLSDESRGIFTGKLFIAKNSQEVDANQLSKNLLLSPKAHVDTRPQLEVYADDVKAAHGATVGQIGEDEIFYLQSRGINQERAYNILCNAFSVDAINKINSTQLRSYLLKQINKKINYNNEGKL